MLAADVSRKGASVSRSESDSPDRADAAVAGDDNQQWTTSRRRDAWSARRKRQSRTQTLPAWLSRVCICTATPLLARRRGPSKFRPLLLPPRRSRHDGRDRTSAPPRQHNSGWGGAYSCFRGHDAFQASSCLHTESMGAAGESGARIRPDGRCRVLDRREGVMHEGRVAVVAVLVAAARRSRGGRRFASSNRHRA